MELLASENGSGDPSPKPQRVVYPYSVLPGGARTPEELREATERDPLIASHYVGFDFRNAKVITVEHAKLVYLSYRQRNKIFWTKRQVTLREGERLLTDGKIFARTRCANRVSVRPRRAASTEEPSPEELERPIASGGTAMRTPFPVTFESNLLSHRNSDWFDPADPPNSGWGYGQYASNDFPLTFPPPLPAGGSFCEPTKPKKKAELSSEIELEGKKKPRKNPCAPGPSGPPATVPEPETVILFVSGLLAILLGYVRQLRLS
ncbi:MAG: hypothetical protein NVS1B11_06490 [Terriglobales bacterium]